METNPNEYDRTVSWVPQQNQVYAARGTGQYGQRPALRQVPSSRTEGEAQKSKLPKPMPKVRALALAHTMKQGLVVASFVGFGTLSGLVAFHQVGTTAKTSSTSSSSQTKQTSTTSSQKTSTSSSNGFLKQQGGSNAGSSNSSQGSNSTSSKSSSNSSSSTSSSNNSGSSTSSSSSSSQPVSGTSTS